MAKTGFNKATEKMFRGFGAPVKIAEAGSVERISSEERERMEREQLQEAERKEEEARDDERRKVIKDLVDMNVIPASGQNGVAVEEKKRGRGRPPKTTEDTVFVLMNFRVSSEFRQRVKMLAVRQDCSIVDLFEEAFGLLFAKYPDK